MRLVAPRVRPRVGSFVIRRCLVLPEKLDSSLCRGGAGSHPDALHARLQIFERLLRVRGSTRTSAVPPVAPPAAPPAALAAMRSIRSRRVVSPALVDAGLAAAGAAFPGRLGRRHRSQTFAIHFRRGTFHLRHRTRRDGGRAVVVEDAARRRRRLRRRLLRARAASTLANPRLMYP